MRAAPDRALLLARQAAPTVGIDDEAVRAGHDAAPYTAARAMGLPQDEQDPAEHAKRGGDHDGRAPGRNRIYGDGPS